MNRRSLFIVLKLVLFLFVSSIILTIPLYSDIPDSERAALIALYNATDGDNWNNNSGWKTPPLEADGFAQRGTEDNWYGVGVRWDEVVFVWLAMNNLEGTIPQEIVNLTKLEKFNAYSNKLTGTFPIQFASLPNLKELVLNSNLLSGGIPAEIGQFQSLTRLQLRGCRLGGPIPPQIGNVVTLTYLELTGNDLTGPIPPQIGNLVNLRSLYLNVNQLTSIPVEIGNLTKLTVLYLDNSALTGNIPPQLGNLENLQTLSLYHNSLEGTIPPELGNLENLQSLGLGVNNLTGSIPPQLGNLSKLVTMNLANNQLTGAIPPEIGKITTLKYLALERNQLTGSIPPEIGDCTELYNISLGFNNLSGPIPAAIGNLVNLNFFDVRENQITGIIPPEIGNMASLRSFTVMKNQVSGPIPPDIGNLSNLQYLYLNENQLSGSIPPEFGNLAKLQQCHLDINSLSGSLPSSIGNLTQLQNLHIENNQISGNIPPEIGNLTNLRWLYMDNNRLSGSIPVEFKNMSTLSYCKLNNNSLSGGIPKELASMSNLRNLYLNGNKLSGDIPADFKWVIRDYSVFKIDYNALYCLDYSLRSQLNDKSAFWYKTQTIAPTELSATAVSPTAVDLTWTPISYIDDPGGYEIYSGTTPGGPYILAATAIDKNTATYQVTGLAPATTHYFVIKSKTDPHAGNFNIVTSEYSEETSATTFIPPSFLLTVQSSPDAGAVIEVVPNDTNGQGNGTTEFVRTYYENTVVSLTAPTFHNGRIFSKWVVDGADNVAQTIDVTMDDNHTVMAVYVDIPRTLTVQSFPDAGMEIGVAPPDNNGQGNGFTQFTRVYNNGTTVSLTAPAVFNGKVFSEWVIDGVDNPSRTINVVMDKDIIVVAKYLTVYPLNVQSAPDTNIGIDVVPADINGDLDGNTNFTRTYFEGTLVNLTAPAVFNGKVFSKWIIDSTTENTNAMIQVSMNQPHTVVAQYLNVYSLSVQSTPATGATITVTPNDKDGNGDGATNFIRNYIQNSVVNLTAPAEYGGKVFSKWIIDGTIENTNATIQVTMDNNHTAVAEYVDKTYTLDVQSQPDTGITINVSPNDKNGAGNGQTNFTRTYVQGTAVTLTAPDTHNGRVFSEWVIDGTDNSSRAITVTMDKDHTVVAKYVDVHTLTVQSTPVTGVSISVSPNDRNGAGNGVTNFERSYVQGTSVTLTAPAAHGARVFSRWTIDGTGNTARTITVTMDKAHLVVAEYVNVYTLDVQSAPDKGITIDVSPNDHNNAGDGVTDFKRIYVQGTSVQLTAPADFNGRVFSRWVIDGSGNTNQTITVTMNADHTVVAEYVNLYTLTVQSTLASAVDITVTPNDYNGDGDGTTNFARTYVQGTGVSLTAPATHSGLEFSKWVIDGSDNTNATISVTMNAPHTVNAVYVTPSTYKLTVQSTPDTNVGVTVTPVDNNGDGDGRTDFSRIFNTGTTVTLVANPWVSGGQSRAFVKWVVDGDEYWDREISLTMNKNYTAVAHYGIVIWLNKDSLSFKFNKKNNNAPLPSGNFRVASRGGDINWSVSADVDWLTLSPTSGSTATNVDVQVNDNARDLDVGDYTATVTVSAPEAGNSPLTVTVALEVKNGNGNNARVSGEIVTPVNGSSVNGAVPVAGWAVGEMEIETVKLYLVENDKSTYLGDAVFPEGARYDIEAAYPENTFTTGAGWGYLLETGLLPESGNGEYTIRAVASDADGNTAELGTHTVYCDNNQSGVPYGALEMPQTVDVAAGNTISVSGWAFGPGMVPVDSSGFTVWLDGVSVGSPVSGSFLFDTGGMKPGIHTLAWAAADDAGNPVSIGNRYIMIRDTENPLSSNIMSLPAETLSAIPVDTVSPMNLKTGYGAGSALQQFRPDETGAVTVETRELEPVEIHLNDSFGTTNGYSVYLVEGDRLRVLPAGARLDSRSGILTWQPGAGYFGYYRLAVVEKTAMGQERLRYIDINIVPRFDSKTDK